MSLPGGSEASPDHAGLRGTRTMRYDHPGYPVRSSRGVLPPGLARRHAAFSAARAAGTLERKTRAVRRRGPPVGSEPRAALVCPGVSPCVNRRDLRRAASFAFWVGTASCSPVTTPVPGLVRARRRLLTNTARNARRSVTCSSATGFVTSARARPSRRGSSPRRRPLEGDSPTRAARHRGARTGRSRIASGVSTRMATLDE